MFLPKTAIVHGERRISYGIWIACRQLAAAIIGAGRATNHCVCSMSNVPEMLELHLCANDRVLDDTRLDAKTIATILGHGESQMLFVEECDVAEAALDVRSQNPGYWYR